MFIVTAPYSKIIFIFNALQKYKKCAWIKMHALKSAFNGY